MSVSSKLSAKSAVAGNEQESNGNSALDWEIFDILCKDELGLTADPVVPCVDHHHVTHSLDLATTLKTELAAANYKRDRLLNELADLKGNLCARDAECDTLRTQTARQSALIGSLQAKLQAVENRERQLQSRSENAIQTLQREKKLMDDRVKDLVARMRRLEGDLSAEESQREQIQAQLQDFVRRLCVCLAIDICESTNLSPELVVAKAGEIVNELQRLRTKLTTTCDNLHTCESELLATRTAACNDKQRLTQQVESLQAHTKDMENRCRQAERDLQLTRDRLSECETGGDKLREELRGFESRCCRLQNTIDRLQTDRLQYLRNLSSITSLPEPCETMIKDKVRDLVNDNQALQTQLNNLREQINTDATRHREIVETTANRLRCEEMQKSTVEERLEKATHELHHLKNEHMTLSDYLVRLSRALAWSECTGSPAPGADTTLLAETLLERAERLVNQHDHHHGFPLDCKTWESTHALNPHHHHFHSLKLRRERSCHDIPIKETTAMFNLQRRMRVLRDQMQKKDLQIELLKRKLTLMEEGARGKCLVQSERDEAICRAKRTTKQAEKACQQLIEAKAQISELKAQLVDAAENKICALERARKIDELQARIAEMENEKGRLVTQLTNYKARCRSTVDCSIEKTRRDEQTINNMREDIARLRTQLSEANHKLSQLQTFRTSVARLLHLRDIPHSSLLQRLQTLCHAHQEFTMLSRRYESVSPIVDHPCPRYETDLIPPSNHCRPLSSSSGNPPRRFDDSGLDEHFEDELEFLKKKGHY